MQAVGYAITDTKSEDTMTKTNSVESSGTLLPSNGNI